MSESTEVTTQESATTVTPEAIAEMQAQLDKLKATNQRLVEESSRFKESAVEKEARLEEIQKAKLQEEGKHEELLEMERNKAHQALQEAQAAKRNAMESRLNFEIAARAKDAIDVQDVIYNIKHDYLEFDDESQNFTRLMDGIEDVRSRKPHLFAKKNVVKTPSDRPSANLSNKKLGELTTAELKGLHLQRRLNNK